MLSLFEFAAVVASCLYGIMQARQHKMDFLGVFSVAFATALGGGTFRDLLLNRERLFWLEHESYLYIVFGVVLVTAFIPRMPRLVEKILPIPDAIGLGLFSVVGTAYALESGTGWFTAAMFGMITGSFGGVVSDVLCNQVPTLFRPAPLYATCSFVGSWVYLVALACQVPPALATAAGFTAVVGLRFAALRFDWRLPGHGDYASSAPR